mgnify:CR=1 FL=1
MLRRNLEAVARAIREADGAYEILVVDNGPTPISRAGLDRAASGCRLRCFRSRPGCKTRALNRGIRESDSRWLIFTDDDTVPRAGWIRAAEEYADREMCRVFGGQVVPGPGPESVPRWYKPSRSGAPPWTESVFVRYAPRSESGLLSDEDPVPFGSNIFVRRDVFVEYGGYDDFLWDACGKAALGVEDGEFGVRLKGRGEPIGYCAEAIVEHPVHRARFNFRDQCRLHYYYGFRDPFVFFRRDRSALEGYRVKSLTLHVALAVLRAMTLDIGEGSDHLFRAARDVGAIHGRLSKGYRRWLRLASQATRQREQA